MNFSDVSVEIVTSVIALGSAIVSGALSYLYTRRKYNAEVNGNRIENMQKSLEFYEHNQEVNKKILDEVQKDNEELREENRLLKEKIDNYEEVIRSLTARVTALEEHNEKKNNGVKVKKSSKKE